MKDSPLKVVGYARVSTENQLENYSIPQQEQRLAAYALAKGWELHKIYIDGGYSGGNMERPGLQELLRIVQNGGIDAVLVYKLDRLSRSQKDTLLLIEDGFLAHGTDFISINENFDTSTPFGRAMIGMLSVFAQLERDQITERFTMGRVGRSKAGYFHGGGSPPTGYRYERGELLVEPYQALQVQEAFRLFLSGCTINSVSRQLSAQFSHSWTPSKVRAILKNDIYTGHVHFKGQGYPGRHQPIIGEDSFQAAAERLAELGKNGARPAFRFKYLLSGLITCGSCGAKYAAGHGYYRCYSRAKTSPKYVADPDCPGPDWPIAQLNCLLLEQLRLFLEQPGVAALLASQPSKQPEAGNLPARLEEISTQQGRLAELFQMGLLPKDVLAQRAQALSVERETLAAQLERQEPAPLLPGQELEAFWQGFYSAEVGIQRAFLAALIQQITIEPEQVVIRWRI
jgi:site-specific DNA recombinase